MAVEQLNSSCAVCKGQNGTHNKISVPYPWPLQRAVFKTMACPNA